ncbi:MAG: GNAT family N-acetyltransferase [Saprospiraceae bacterium]|nr:GNAT family N-acetyltransferase [Saprospiraceae bacterium]
MLPLYPLLSQLNSRITAAQYIDYLDDMIAHGYRMVVMEDESGTPVAMSGIWVTTKFYSGRYLEMDNVVVAETHRSSGLGKQLSDFVLQIALNEKCQTIMLDAYLENESAHRFYEREGFVRKGYHFLKTL